MRRVNKRDEKDFLREKPDFVKLSQVVAPAVSSKMRFVIEACIVQYAEHVI